MMNANGGQFENNRKGEIDAAEDFDARKTFHTRDWIVLIESNIVFATTLEFLQLCHDQHGSLSALCGACDRVHLPELGLVFDEGTDFQVGSFRLGRVEARLDTTD